MRTVFEKTFEASSYRRVKTSLSIRKINSAARLASFFVILFLTELIAICPCTSLWHHDLCRKKSNLDSPHPQPCSPVQVIWWFLAATWWICGDSDTQFLYFDTSYLEHHLAMHVRKPQKWVRSVEQTQKKNIFGSVCLTKVDMMYLILVDPAWLCNKTRIYGPTTHYWLGKPATTSPSDRNEHRCTVIHL